MGQTTNRTRLAREIDTAVAKTGADVLAAREQRAWRRRGVWLGERDGQPALEARLSVEGAAAVRAALESLGRLDTAGDTRTVAQRHHDALVTLATRYLDEGKLPTVATQRPHVLLVTTPDALHDVQGAEPSLLDGHGPVSPDLTRQICCDASSGQRHRRSAGTLFSARVGGAAPRNQAARAEERALKRPSPSDEARAARSERARCQIHHIVWRRHHGRTETDNLTLVCWTCHRHIHNQGWQVTRNENGRYTAGPPALAPPGTAPPHLDNNIEKPALAHTG